MKVVSPLLVFWLKLYEFFICSIHLALQAHYVIWILRQFIVTRITGIPIVKNIPALDEYFATIFPTA
jgi:hypothetical protein